jgi:23S rRNA (cytosine1962-C5)-methyltransferase
MTLTTPATALNRLRLNRDADRRLSGGHLWIYSNEVAAGQTPLKSFEPGEQVVVESAHGKVLGVAMMSPQSLICARMVSEENIVLDVALLKTRLQRALALRQRCYQKPFYRLVYGDSDFLPGLIVDRFGNYFSVQLNSPGMDRLAGVVVDVLDELFKPKGILLKNDSSAREAEGLDKSVHVAQGDIPDLVEIEENNTSIMTSLKTGQKTGWFYDHQRSRRDMQALVKDKTVLDVFSYVGSWGIQALQAGATQVTCVDTSDQAIQIAQQNAHMNQARTRFTTHCGTAIDVLKQMVAERKSFDLIVLDPPAFIKKIKDKIKGTEAYHHHNQLALRLLKPEGILISASCSMHLAREELVNVIRVAGNKTHRSLQIFQLCGQGPDHPVHPAIPETEYLKTVFVRAN